MSENVRSIIQLLLLSVMILSSCTLQAFAYYHPDEGRWINRDPIGEQGGENLYAMVANSAISNVDPRGLFLIVTAELTGFHAGAELFSGPTKHLPSYADWDSRGPGWYSKPGVSSASDWGVTWGWIRGRTDVPSLPNRWLSHGADSVQWSAHVKVRMSICGCCPFPERLRVDWKARAIFHYSEYSSSGATSVTLNGRRLALAGRGYGPRNQDQSDIQEGSEWYGTAGWVGCETLDFVAANAWMNGDQMWGTARFSATAKCM